MSTEQATLGDAVDRRLERDRQTRRRQFDGAKYRGGERETFDEPSDTRVCRNCGSDVPADVGRVVGDRDDCVPVCRECTRARDGTKPRSTAKAVEMVTRTNAVTWTVLDGAEVDAR